MIRIIWSVFIFCFFAVSGHAQAPLPRTKTIQESIKPSQLLPRIITQNQTINTISPEVASKIQQSLKWVFNPHNLAIVKYDATLCPNAQMDCLRENEDYTQKAVDGTLEGTVIDQCVKAKNLTCEAICSKGNGRVGDYYSFNRGFNLPVNCTNGFVTIDIYSCNPDTTFPFIKNLAQGQEEVSFCYGGKSLGLKLVGIHTASPGQHACKFGGWLLINSGISIVPSDSTCTAPLEDGYKVCVTAFEETAQDTCQVVLDRK